MTADRWTQQDLDELLFKNRTYIDGKDISNDGEDTPESALQSKIKAYCKGKGWPVLAFPESRKVVHHLPPGWPDISMILPFGTVLFLELKSKKGSLRESQKLMKRMFAYLGHTIHEVKTYKRFLEIAEKVTRRE